MDDAQQVNDVEMPTYKHDEVRTLVRHSATNNDPLMLWGGTGIGKSQLVREEAEAIASDKYPDREFVVWNQLSNEQKQDVHETPADYVVYKDVRLSQYDAASIRGIPQDGGYGLEWKLPKWLHVMIQEDAAGIIFMDECNLAPPAVQSDFYQMILDHEIVDYSLSEDVFVIGAGNREGIDRANVYEMAAPLRNRFMHAHLAPPRGGEDGNWTAWAMEHDIDPRIISFIGSSVGREHLYQFEEYKDKKTIPTPRGWERLSDHIKNIDDPEMVKQVARSILGDAVATQFVEFLALREHGTIENYLDHPERVKELDNIKGGNATDIKIRVAGGLARAYRDDQSADTLQNIVEVAEHMETPIGALMLDMVVEFAGKTTIQQQMDKISVDKETAERYAKVLVDRE